MCACGLCILPDSFCSFSWFSERSVILQNVKNNDILCCFWNLSQLIKIERLFQVCKPGCHRATDLRLRLLNSLFWENVFRYCEMNKAIESKAQVFFCQVLLCPSCDCQEKKNNQKNHKKVWNQAQALTMSGPELNSLEQNGRGCYHILYPPK